MNDDLYNERYEQTWSQVRGAGWYEAWYVLYYHMNKQVYSKVMNGLWESATSEHVRNLVRTQTDEDIENEYSTME